MTSLSHVNSFSQFYFLILYFRTKILIPSEFWLHHIPHTVRRKALNLRLSFLKKAIFYTLHWESAAIFCNFYYLRVRPLDVKGFYGPFHVPKKLFHMQQLKTMFIFAKYVLCAQKIFGRRNNRSNISTIAKMKTTRSVKVQMKYEFVHRILSVINER